MTVHLRPKPKYLPLHLVWPITLAQAESRGEVAGEEFLFLDGGQEGLVDSLLVGGTAGGWLLLLLDY